MFGNNELFMIVFNDNAVYYYNIRNGVTVYLIQSTINTTKIRN